MTQTKTLTSGSLPFGQKLAYGLGNFVNNFLPGALGTFSVFLLTIFGIDPLVAGVLSLVPRLYDAITDPIMGYISDNTHSRWGRRRPYIFIGAILSGVVFVLLWQMDQAAGGSHNFWYYTNMMKTKLYGAKNPLANEMALGKQHACDVAH